MDRRIPESESLAREYLANERTLLSWVRTGVGAIGVGILLDSVGRALGTLSGAPPGLGLFAIAVVVLGVCINLIATARFMQYRIYIRRGVFTSSVLVYLLVVFGLLLLSVAYAIYVVVA
jgi:putative membrane protein